MHRHRRCIKVMQSFTTAHGYEMLLDMEDAGMRPAAHTTSRRDGRCAARKATSGATTSATGLMSAIAR